MKFIRKKVIKGHLYFYLEFRFGGKIHSKYIGAALPGNLAELIRDFFEKLSTKAAEAVKPEAKQAFAPKSILSLEQNRFWYQSLHHELFTSDLDLFKDLFAVLFILNSNRAEGSRVTRKDIEKIMRRKRKPRSLMDMEILDSFAALRFVFSNEMKWNVKSIQALHRELFHRLSPQIAGQLKEENNTVNNEPTAAWQEVRKKLGELLQWFHAQKKKKYPPLVALEFHHRFEGIHPFLDGNGRIGRLLCNAYLLQSGYMPVIFFSENHASYCEALSQARQGRKRKLFHYFIEQNKKTRWAIEHYKKEGILRGGSPQVGQWEIERGKIRKF